MTNSTLSVRDGRHFSLSTAELADWLGRQAEDSWWSVDGDPFLTQRVDFPCSSETLARELARFDKTLLVLDPRSPDEGIGGNLTHLERLDAVAVNVEGDRIFQMSWGDDPAKIDWLLCEDKDTGGRSLGLEDVEDEAGG